MNETVKIWLEKLGNPTAEEIKAEIEEVKGTIANEKLWAYADNIHYDNIAALEEYREVLEEMLQKIKIRYYVCALGYDGNDLITDYEKDFGDFDTYEEAYELFVKIQCRPIESFFEEVPELHKLLLVLEECQETDEVIECIDVKNEWHFINPKFDEEE